MPDRTTPISLRIDKTVLNRIREQSDIEGISLNALMNRIVEEYVDWHRYAPKAGFVTVHKLLLIRLMNRISSKELARVSEFMTMNEIKGMLMTLRSKWDVLAFLDSLKSWANVCGFSFRHVAEEDFDLFIIQHDMGLKWSNFLGGIFKLILADFMLGTSKFEITDHVISFKIKLKKLRSKRPVMTS